MKKKILRLLSLVFLLMIPILVLADDLEDAGLFGVLGMHLMLTLHSAGFFCLPASMIFKSANMEQKKVFWRVFWGRAVTVIVLAIISPELSIGLDVASIFIGGFIGFPMTGVIDSMRRKKVMSNQTTIANSATNVVTEVKCPKCGTVVTVGNTFCTNCGTKVPENAVAMTTSNAGVLSLPSASAGKPLGAAGIFGYNLTEDQMVAEIIRREMEKTGETNNVSIAAVEKKKNIFSIVYAIILLICISLFFFHSHTAVLVIVFIIVTIIYFNSVKNYNIYKYLQKEVKARPDEKIGYIVSSVMAGKISNGSYKFMRLAFMLVAIAVPMLIFRAPHVIYEHDDTLDGYVIRFYTIGWLENDKELEIPEEYKGEDVVGIRGDVFANVKTIEKVVLPDTIKEIRGGAFTNASNLEEINLPEGIPEIKGETFQGCSSLKEITIPDSVTRIGGHAFRENYSLEKVNISPNSKLTEIGSSAFRDCYELEEIYLPRDVYVNERAFKDSGTNVKEYTVDGIVLQDEYEYDTYVYLEVGESDEINKYNDDALTQGYKVRLDKVEGDYGDYTFAITILKEDGGARTFPLYREASYFVVKDYGIAVEVTNDYVFDSYDDRVALNIYYN